MNSSRPTNGPYKNCGGFGPPRIEEVVELLLNWYIQKTGPSHLQTIRDTEYVLRLWGKIGEKEKPPHPMGNFVVDKGEKQ